MKPDRPPGFLLYHAFEWMCIKAAQLADAHISLPSQMLFSKHHVPECVCIISGTQDPSIFYCFSLKRSLHFLLLESILADCKANKGHKG